MRNSMQSPFFPSLIRVWKNGTRSPSKVSRIPAVPVATRALQAGMHYTFDTPTGSFMKFFCAVLACATLCIAAPKIEPKSEIGEINGAKFRIDIPENWNGGLVMYCHGYSPVAGAYKEGKLPAFLEVFTGQGYAVAQSGYAAGGWAIQEGIEDTEALRRYFATKYGQPKETYITGHSMGGFLT